MEVVQQPELASTCCSLKTPKALMDCGIESPTPNSVGEETEYVIYDETLVDSATGKTYFDRSDPDAFPMGKTGTSCPKTEVFSRRFVARRGWEPITRKPTLS